MPGRPAYAVDSVDSALRLLQILQRDGVLSVSEAAIEIGVAKSTVHRLVAMLCFRGFAVRGVDRRYRPGPALGGVVEQGSDALLVELAHRHLENLSREVGETVNLMVLRGADVAIVDCVESDHVLRVGNRAGTRMPARVTSGGLALLANLSRQDLEALHPDLVLDSTRMASLLSQLSSTKRLGYGVNYEASEVGVTAIGAAVYVAGTPLAAVTVSAPAARYRRGQITRLYPALDRCRHQLEVELGRALA